MDVVMVKRRLRYWSLAVLFTVALCIFQILFPELRVLPDFSVGGSAGLVFLALFLSALVCEFVDASIGMGYGTTLTPLLLLSGFEPIHIVPAILFSQLVAGIAAGIFHQHDGNVDFRASSQARGVLFQLSGLSAVGALLAVWVAITLSKVWFGAIIAIILISVGITVLATSGKKIKFRSKHILLIGTIAAFNKSLSGGGYGPLVTSGQVVSGVSAKEAVAITSVAESLTCLIGLLAYAAMVPSLSLALAWPLGLGALCSVPLASLAVHHIPERAMKVTVGAGTITLGVLSLVKVIAVG